MSEPQLKKKDILEAAKGMLCKDLYVIITTPTGGLGPIMENLEAHLGFHKSLEEKGVTFGSGPFFADNEEDWQGDYSCWITCRGQGNRGCRSHAYQRRAALHGSSVAFE